MRVATIGTPSPYEFFGTFAGLPFWKGGLTFVAAAPGIGKTSWLLRMVFEASAAKFPAVVGCFDHTEEEMNFRLTQQAKAMIAGPHGSVSEAMTQDKLVECSEAVLIGLDDARDTVRAFEETLLNEYQFPKKGPALVGMDYLDRIPVVGLTGMVPLASRSGDAAGELRNLGRRRDWAIISPVTLKPESFHKESWDLDDLAGDGRAPYIADRVMIITRIDQPRECGCLNLRVHTIKDRTGPIMTRDIQFWGERFYPALEHEFYPHLFPLSQEG